MTFRDRQGNRKIDEMYIKILMKVKEHGQADKPTMFHLADLGDKPVFTSFDLC